MSDRTYINLSTLIEFGMFDFDQYLTDEREVLQPKLEALGFTDISWDFGETDSFGPLTRTCQAKDNQGNVLHFMYG